MKSYQEISNEILKALKDKDLEKGLVRSIENFTRNISNILDRWGYLKDYAEYIKKVKEEVFKNIDYYIDITLKNLENISGHGYYARDYSEVYKIIDNIAGNSPKIIVKAKSMVTEEIKLREYLISRGHIVYETDLGEFLIQISKEKPMHAIAPAIHLTKDRAIRLLRKAGLNVTTSMPYEEIVKEVRRFLRDKFINADIGISGANAVAADTGAIFLVSNEGNIRNVTNLPKIHIAITGIEKIMPTLKDAFIQAIVQAGYAGLYPPTYISLIAGPSSTADIEFHRVYGVHGPEEYHLILYDGGRRKALEDPSLREQLYCIRCGRCQEECPVWDIVGNIWGGSVYGGPMGIGWTAITEGIKYASILSNFCLNCGRCKIICPLNIDIPTIIHNLRIKYFMNRNL